MHRGYLKLWRKIKDWEWYGDPNIVALFIHLLLTANIDDRKWRGKLIKRGQLVAGRRSLSKETGISEQSIRTSLEKLKLTHEITIQSTNLYSIITLNNYELYNENQPTNQPTNQPAINQPSTTTKEYKNIRNNIYVKEAQQFLKEFNHLTGSKGISTKAWIDNFIKWRKEYSLKQMGEAVYNARYHQFWKDKLTPVKLFRTRNKNGDCDVIDELLNTKDPK